MEERDAWIGFSVFPGIGPKRFNLLCEYFGSAKAAWNASVSELYRTGLGEGIIRTFDSFRRGFDCVTYNRSLSRRSVRTILLSDREYPPLLKEISDAPIVLYVLGHTPIETLTSRPMIAVVGTRHMTQYGEAVIRRIIPPLVAAGCVIVSGMAYGVDASAHWETIRSNGQTIAVLGCGIDIIAPPSNARLYHEIQNGHGLIVSEMPLAHRPLRGLFPARNRIISGLSRATLIVEGAGESGSLITARMAAEQGREVCAVPGSVTSPYSVGPHRLLRSGAVLVERADDILEAIGLGRSDAAVSTVAKGDTECEQRILSILAPEHLHFNALVSASGLTVSSLAATLTVLEIKGCVRDFGGKVYGLI